MGELKGLAQGRRQVVKGLLEPRLRDPQRVGANAIKGLSEAEESRVTLLPHLLQKSGYFFLLLTHLATLRASGDRIETAGGGGRLPQTRDKEGCGGGLRGRRGGDHR